MLCVKAKTRTLFNNCSGILRKPTPQVCRAGGIETCEAVCQRHFDEIRREDNKRCSCPSSWGHSEKLHGHPILRRFYQILDEVGANCISYKPGTRWCNKCRTEAPGKIENWPLLEEFTCKRRKKNLETEVHVLYNVLKKARPG